MKKLILLFILLPALAFSQGDSKKSAEDFMYSYLKNWENKNWDEILNSFNEDCSLIGLNKTIPFQPVLKSTIEYYKINLKDYKAKIYSIETEILSSTTVWLVVRGIHSAILPGPIDESEFLNMYLLEKTGNDWKFKSVYNLELNPYIFSDSVEKKWQTGRQSSRVLLNSTILRWNHTVVTLLEERKKDGINLSEWGKVQATKGAKDWWFNSAEFTDLVAGVNFYLEHYAPSIEILERNDVVFKIKFKPTVIPAQSSITKREYLDYYGSFFGELSSHMKGTSSIVEDGEYWILTLNKMESE